MATIAKEDIIKQVPYFTRYKDETAKKKGNKLNFSRLDCGILFNDIFEIAEDISDIKWIAEQICSCINIAMGEWKEDILREQPDREEEFEDFEPCIEVYV